MIEVASSAVKSTESGALYQPFPFGGLEAVAVAVGAVASYFTAREAVPAFPALSRQVPETAADAESGPEYALAASQESTVEVASVAAKLTESGALYQPLPFGWREGVAVATGAGGADFSAEDA